jgi:DNA-directed RNA polymerase subunit beta'
MLASNNVLVAGHGRPIITPSQDMVLGCYYLTAENPYEQKGGRQILWQHGRCHYGL